MFAAMAPGPVTCGKRREFDLIAEAVEFIGGQVGDYVRHPAFLVREPMATDHVELRRLIVRLRAHLQDSYGWDPTKRRW